MTDRQKRRLDRQFSALGNRSPALRGLIAAIQGRPGVVLRVPLALLLILGGFLAILPVFGLWMIPLGLLVLAIDLPLLRPSVSAAIIRLRRKWSLWRRKEHKND
ncbi:tryptophan synthase subunit beta [Plastorhodobacter daqingensis]|uniref:Tryptophan synthase subunit beta n=1 Tax=Plastorhodobacter daqingensis TaxID=1387281 RepID=A0ABW2UPC0_9RHOB